MKKHYYLSRIIRSIISIFLVITIIFTLLYTLIDRDTIFAEDLTYQKLNKDKDKQVIYKHQVWKRIGYLDYVTMSDYCAIKYEVGSSEINECNTAGSKDEQDFVAEYEKQGYTIKNLPVSKSPLATKDRPLLVAIGNWFKSMIDIDHVNYIQDPNNPNLERSVTLGTTPTGGFAVKCSGCNHKYLVYTDLKFPFIHQNVINFNLGKSFPTYEQKEVLAVISQPQGKDKLHEVTNELGTFQTNYNMNSCVYKSTLTKLDQAEFADNYANCTTDNQDPSMIGVSFIMGSISVAISYIIGISFGNFMAKRKGKIGDKLGMGYIIFMIAVPSLAYINLVKYIGTTLFGLPGAFPVYGAQDIRSWILPIVSLSLSSIAGMMLWTRRYMVDQMNSDYVKFARAKGLNQNEIYKKHILRNAIIPIVHGIPVNIAASIMGALITEKIYSVGGMGKLLPDSIQSYNNPMIVALAFIFTSISIIGVFLGDILITKVDPRIQLYTKETR